MSEPQTESAEQQAVIRWWLCFCVSLGFAERLLMASCGQAMRTQRNGRRMKAEGYRAGTPDLFLAVPRGKHHGLFIEMKRADGGLADASTEQREQLFELGLQDYRTAIACGAAQAISVIKEYLNT